MSIHKKSKLKVNSYNQSNQHSFIGGARTVQALLDQRHVQKILHLDLAANHPISIEAQQQGISLQQVSESELEKLATNINHQGVVALCKPPQKLGEAELKEHLNQTSRPQIYLMLDHIEDVGNFGAILRSAAGFGVSTVIIPNRRAAPLNQTVHKTSSGASYLLNIYQVSNLVRILQRLQEHNCYIVGMSEQATDSLSDISLDSTPTQSLVLVIGNEHHGISRLCLENCDQLCAIDTIPAFPSLNASVATGIALAQLSVFFR